MIGRNTAVQWGGVARALHWLMALLIIGTSIFVLHVNDSMPWFQSTPLVFITYIHWHKAFGLLALVLVLVRLAWRKSGVVPQTAPLTPFEQLWSHRAHIGLYALMLAVPITGWLASSAFGSSTKVFGLFTVPGIIAKSKPLVAPTYWAHFGLAWALLALVVVHIIAAFWHHDRRRDNVLMGMWKGRPREKLRDQG
jgi:cytochrome b561